MDIFQIKVTLRDIDPPIWRRILVRADTRLGRLHDILQVVMGWEDCHLHRFAVGGTEYGVPDPDFPSDLKSERNVRLDKVAAEGAVFLYEYDFGDGWEHDLVIEAALPAQNRAYPACVAGERACPPEDCGGPYGYARLLEALADPDDEEHDELLHWVGGRFDPERFSVASLNRRLRRLR